MDGLQQYYLTSEKLAKDPGNINDNRILAIHLIFPFLLHQPDSVTKYIGQHNEIMKDILPNVSDSPIISDNLLRWCFSLGKKYHE
ncbi:unnamed protein product [Absidia cylindrospora]